MTTFSFDRVRSGEAQCPSDLALDRMLAGELPFEQKRALELHLDGCAGCKARVRERRAGFEAFPELDSAAVLARIEASREPAPASPERQRGMTRWLAILGGLAVAAASLIVALRPSPDSELTTVSGTRLKGGLTLRVYRQQGDESEEVLSGERFRPGDRLRFRISTPSEGYVSILGVEADAELYTAWPLDGHDAPRRLEAAKDQLLDGAVEIDAAPGRETLWLVHCATQHVPPRCTSKGANVPPQCAPGCTLTSFTMDKSP